MVGGIDGPKIDVENITEEQIRAEVRRAVDTYCPGRTVLSGNSERLVLPGVERQDRKGRTQKVRPRVGAQATRSLD